MTKMESKLLKSILLIYYVELCGYGIWPFLPQVVISQYVLPSEKELGKYTGQTIVSKDKELARVRSSIEVINAREINEINRNINTYHEICSQNQIPSLQEASFHGYSDNNDSNNDAVQQQYLQLPYPTIRYDNIDMEYEYYLNQNNYYPLSTQYPMKLEYLNHYLYKGKNSFEYVFIFGLI